MLLEESISFFLLFAFVVILSKRTITSRKDLRSFQLDSFVYSCLSSDRG